jgi:hypothetical protein
MNSIWSAEGWKIKSRDGGIYKFKEFLGFGEGLKILVQIYDIILIKCELVLVTKSAQRHSLVVST